MPIAINCPQCGARGSVPDAFRGKNVRCPRCSHSPVPVEDDDSVLATVDTTAEVMDLEVVDEEIDLEVVDDEPSPRRPRLRPRTPARPPASGAVITRTVVWIICLLIMALIFIGYLTRFPDAHTVLQQIAVAADTLVTMFATYFLARGVDSLTRH